VYKQLTIATRSCLTVRCIEWSNGLPPAEHTVVSLGCCVVISGAAADRWGSLPWSANDTHSLLLSPIIALPTPPKQAWRSATGSNHNLSWAVSVTSPNLLGDRRSQLPFPRKALAVAAPIPAVFDANDTKVADGRPSIQFARADDNADASRIQFCSGASSI
jgi:hypothetical protein